MAFESWVEDKLFPVIHLKDGQGGCSAEIYSFGALLNAFTITKDGKGHNVIDGFTNMQQAVENITAGFKSAKLSPFVCRVTAGKYAFGGESFLLKKFFLGEEAIHGLLFDAPFTIKEKGADGNNAYVVLEYDYNNTLEGYPFAYNIQITYSLKANGVLSLVTVVTNTGTADMPLADGWHPYFTLGGPVNELLVTLNATQMLEFSERLVPTGSFINHTLFSKPTHLGETFFDNCFVVGDAQKPACIIKNESTGLTLNIMATSGYPYLQIYTPPHRKSIAIENLSSAPDAFNNGIGLIIAKPHEHYIFAADYILQFEHKL